MADIQHLIQIAATPDQIHPLVATPRGLGQWWATDVVESASGVELGFFNRTTLYRLRLKTDRPPSHTEWVCETGDEWKGTHIVFKLEPTPAGTLLRFSHAGWQTASDYFITCNTTWGELMFRLRAAAEGKAPGPLFSVAGMGA